MNISAEIKTRMAVDADLPEIQELYAIWGHAFVYLVNDQTFVARVNGRIVGAVRLAFEESTFVVRSLFVLKKFRKQGIAKALLEIVEAELGHSEAYCLLPAQQKHLFAHIGFNLITGISAPGFLIARRDNLNEDNQDVIIMKRTFGVEVGPLPAKHLPLAMDLIREFEFPEAKELSENDVRGIYSKIVAAGGAVLGAYRGEKIVGTCTLNVCANLSWSGRPYGIVENIIVTRSERNKGIGKSLLLFARRMAESKNCYKVALMVEQIGPENASFFRAAGFTDDQGSYQRRANV